MRRGATRPATAGFTLFEALVSVALMGLIVTSLSAVVGQWLPNWHRGFGRVQRLQSLDVGLQRIVDDLDAAEFVTANSQSKFPLFLGDAGSVTLVRAAIGPDTSPHLEIIQLAETSDERGFALVRSRAPFVPLAPNSPIGSQIRFADPVALVRTPFRISFSFTGIDRAWRDTWENSPLLPTAVRVRVRDAANNQTLAVSTATLLNVDLSADCVNQKSIQQCQTGVKEPEEPQPTAPPTPPTTSAAPVQ